MRESPGGGASVRRDLAVAAAVLVPRIASVLSQWILAATAGLAAVSLYASTTYRGSAAVSVVATGLGPVLARRKQSLLQRSPRRCAGMALLLLAGVCAGGTFLYEAVVGVGAWRGAFVAAFAATTIFTNSAVAAWPVWQDRGRFWPLWSLCGAFLLCAMAGAALGRPQAVTLFLGLTGAVPVAAWIGPIGIRKCVRYSWGIIRRSIPLSLLSFGNALVLSTAIAQGEHSLGPGVVGTQAVFWSFATALNFVCQAVAARVVGEKPRSSGEEASRHPGFNRWLGAVLLLSVVSGILYAGFNGIAGASDASRRLPLAVVWTAIACLISDSVCFYFSDEGSRKRFAAGNVLLSGALVVALLLWPLPILGRYGVFGSAGLLSTLRLMFVRSRGMQKWTSGAAVILGLGAVALWFVG